MSNKNSFKRLLGVGAFACCSVILLSVTAQSARNEQIPSVSDLGGMIGGTLRFVQEMNDELPTELEAQALPESESSPEAEDTKADEADDTFTALPDFTDLAQDEPFAAVSAVIEEEPVVFASAPAGTDSADKADGGETAADDWMEEGKKSESGDWMETEEKSSASPNPDKKTGDSSSATNADTAVSSKSEEKAAEAKSGADEKAENAVTPADGKTEDKEKEEQADEKADKEDKKSGETGSDWMDPESGEEDSGVEELTAVAASTLSLAVNNSTHTEYLHGYEDGTARPGGKITRAEACQILYNLLGTKPADRASLSDVKDGAWYAEPMRLLAACGIVDCPNDKARPDDFMTRAELVSALARLVPANSVGEVSFTDVSESHPYYAAIAKAVGLGWVNGYEDGTFKPDGSITRAEAAKVVNRALSRTPDNTWIDRNITSPLYSDLTTEHWAYYELMEASVAHNVVLRNGVEKWKPIQTAPAEDEKPAQSDESVSGVEDGTEPTEGTQTESESETTESKPAVSGWMEGDEELERMLAEPLPPEIDASRLVFDGIELSALDENGERMTDVTLGRYLTFGSDGRYTTGNDELDTYVKEVLNEITTPDMSREEKLEAAFAYCRDTFQYRRRNYYEPGESGWDIDEALTMFKTKKGNCYNFAASFAVLARQLGYDAEAISGLVGSELQSHGWVEIVSGGARLYYDTVLESTYIERGYQPLDFFAKEYETAPWPYHKR
ncbi:MAG: hypothetical protein E7576_00945 [Ruminococcaceae bacterium]|jgi:transglutaminase-like putative cysteine protease|nr:hypothetical protein [Oscillospiraceae bacterium]